MVVCEDVAVAADPHSTAPQPTYHGMDPEQEPSADWGWHGGFPRAGKIAGWITAIAIFAMLKGNHITHQEDSFLIALGTVLVVVLLASHVKAFKAKRRAKRF